MFAWDWDGTGRVKLVCLIFPKKFIGSYLQLNSSANEHGFT